MQLLSPTPFAELRRASALCEDTFVFLRAHANIFTISPRLRWAAFAGVLLHVDGTRALLALYACTIPPRFKESNGRLVRQDPRVCSHTRMLTSRTVECVRSLSVRQDTTGMRTHEYSSRTVGPFGKMLWDFSHTVKFNVYFPSDLPSFGWIACICL
jgi:hypothetical protein